MKAFLRKVWGKVAGRKDAQPEQTKKCVEDIKKSEERESERRLEREFARMRRIVGDEPCLTMEDLALMDKSLAVLQSFVNFNSDGEATFYYLRLKLGVTLRGVKVKIKGSGKRCVTKH